MVHEFNCWQWAMLLAAALLVGVSKTGIAGLGILFVALFASVFADVRQATGVVLPLLIAGDTIAVLLYHRHMRWRWFRRLFPWAALGVIGGFCAMSHISATQARALTGAIVLALTLLHLARRSRAPAATPEPPRWLAPAIGTLAGFTTLVANAAGPLTTVFFLAARLPKLEFVGTGAIFFMILNWFKVPFMAQLGLITRESLQLNALLLPAVLLGAFAGRLLLARINQRLFETLALTLGLLAGIKLIIG
ncbi:MAG: sulfite exporter TauE/SafE family protein [Puniceicoccales bacterium]|jgi:uncharacterized membrane protein YfcA|nr:sulfite exporter TauE/SafE family protein [Puniceicoccales bacterium]